MGNAKDAKLVVDGTTHDLPIERASVGNDGLTVATLLRDTGLVTVDPGFMNTASCSSAITYIDGDNGILRYRGYPIDQLASQSTFLEVAYLLIHGELPSADLLNALENRVARHMQVHEGIKAFLESFPRDAHPMAVLSGALSALSRVLSRQRRTRRLPGRARDGAAARQGGDGHRVPAAPLLGQRPDRAEEGRQRLRRRVPAPDLRAVRRAIRHRSDDPRAPWTCS